MHWMRNSRADAEKLADADLSAHAIYSLLISLAFGTLAQVAVFSFIASVTEVIFTNPPNPSKDHSHPAEFPSYDLLSLLIASFLLLRYSPRLARHLASVGYFGLPAVLTLSMAVFGASYLVLWLPVSAFFLVMPELATGLLLNGLHFAITYGPAFTVAFLSGVHLKLESPPTTRSITEMLVIGLASVILVVAWQFSYWPIWDEGNF